MDALFLMSRTIYVHCISISKREFLRYRFWEMSSSTPGSGEAVLLAFGRLKRALTCVTRQISVAWKRAAKECADDRGTCSRRCSRRLVEDVEKGKVISQSIPAGASVRHDTRSILSSQGPRAFNGSRYQRQDAGDVRQTLESMGLSAEETEAFSSTVAGEPSSPKELLRA